MLPFPISGRQLDRKNTLTTEDYRLLLFVVGLVVVLWLIGLVRAIRRKPVQQRQRGWCRH